MQTQMDRQEWLSEVYRRIGIDEGNRATMYHDTVGIPTIGIGFNLQRDDASEALRSCGCTDVTGVVAGTASLTPPQVESLFRYSFGPIESQARASLATGVYDSMTDARRFVICDLIFNLGNAGWLGFANTRRLLNEAQQKKNAGQQTQAHQLFEEAANHLQASAWYGQVGYRAMRDVAMIRSGVWVDANGDGSG
jgi:GH24 family phage-related lysozyme (muramidase)